ncbi:MAG: hypothetical protein HZA50_03530 [Planctomycetes bacterium]|nr:hypothetical protein [Planctomycetota bacterium]
MRITFVVLACALLAATAGCTAIKDFFTGKKIPQSQPATALAPKPDNDGWHITVFLDGRQTRAGRKIDKDQIWDVEPCGGNPFFKYAMDENRLGKLKQTEVVFKPIINGKVEESITYQLRGVSIGPGKEVKLTGFDYVASGKFASPEALPPGAYQLSVTVFGESSWDRQLVRLTVK